MKWIGLTGGMGCGKSAALSVFKGLGFGAASADAVVHSLYQKKEVVQEVCKALNLSEEGFSTSQVAALVFSDEKKLSILEAVIHPKLRLEVLKIKKNFEEKGFLMGFYEVPLLFEKKMEENFDAIICVGASEPVQLQRIKDRNAWSDEEIKARLQNQMSLNEKAKRADFYIDNSGTKADLEHACKRLVLKL